MTHLKVAVRVRPLSQRETTLQSISVVSVENGNTIAITNVKVPEQNTGDSRERVRRFTFDFCFDEDSTQDEIFEAVGNVIAKAVKKRYHSCVLAYGQSSTGKTHTMMGIQDDFGITPRLCRNIFSYLQESACEFETNELKARVSYLEIYNEKVRDLLVSVDEDPSRSYSNLKVREHPKKGPYVQGLSEHYVEDSESLLEWLHIGNRNRRVAATSTNTQSSRSHSVFTITCHEGVKLHLVDLAGSERAGSRCHTTSRFREGANINKSLVALGNVISALAEKTTRLKSRKRFVPYRDSVLTWLLKDTLGGNSKTVMIATVSPSSTCYNETVNTLRFGQRAKLIITQPIVNEDPKDRTIRELRLEILRLKDLLLLKQITIPQNNNNFEDINEDKNEEIVENKIDDIITSEKTTNEILINRKLENDNINAKPVVETFEKLIPVMNVDSSITDQKKPLPSLRRTYSVEVSNTSKQNPNMFGSQEGIPATSTSKTEKPKRLISSTSNLRRTSEDKTNPALRNMLVKKAFETAPKKIEKGTVTEIKGPKVESRVDSIRRNPVKPRSQIVAAVTHRLYSKVKKKEASTETEDLKLDNEEVPKELKICSNARLKLQELTRQALKAHRRKNEETQTDLFPVLRVKEISTDVDDLKIALIEVKDAETDTNKTETKDVGTSCIFLNHFDGTTDTPMIDFKNAFIVTKSCGTQFSSQETKIDQEKDRVGPEVVQHNPISFTKYLQNHIQPRFEIVNTCTANPIYTTSVNINVSHNYMNGSRVSESVSDDSLEEQPQNVCFPTPDLISNHNSLEPHTHAALSGQSEPNETLKKTTQRIQHAINIAPTEQFVATENFVPSNPTVCTANCTVIPSCVESLNSINLPSTFAPQVCVLSDFEEEHYISLMTTFPEPQQAKISEIPTPNLCTYKIEEPIVLKSIMKQNTDVNKVPDNLSSHSSCKSDSSDVSFDSEIELPDSLNYHKANQNRHVHFCGKPKNDRMMEAMSNFLEEAASLMTNLNLAASQIENNSRPSLQENYELQVTVNDITGLPKPKNKSKRVFKSRKSKLKNYGTQTLPVTESTFVQTSPKKTLEASSSTDDIDIPANKFDELVEESCNKLEKRINSICSRNAERRNSFDTDFLHKFPQPFEVQQNWGREPEDSSLESNPTFSDYGSLPRRHRYIRQKQPTCSPSAFLRQLTSMRQQIIESSREELNAEANMHLF